MTRSDCVVAVTCGFDSHVGGRQVWASDSCSLETNMSRSCSSLTPQRVNKSLLLRRLQIPSVKKAQFCNMSSNTIVNLKLEQLYTV